DGHGVKQILAMPSFYTNDIAVDNRGKKLYFVDNTAGEACRTNLDGSGGFETLLTDVTYAMGIDLYICSPSRGLRGERQRGDRGVWVVEEFVSRSWSRASGRWAHVCAAAGARKPLCRCPRASTPIVSSRRC